jgi:hypothetical protein
VLHIERNFVLIWQSAISSPPKKLWTKVVCERKASQQLNRLTSGATLFIFDGERLKKAFA